jgi:N-acetylglucosamine kinase-like BadF-type ATPase
MAIHAERWRFDAACLGMSGGAADKSELLRELIAAEHIIITDDANTALAGALAGEPGIVVIGGTGSIAFGKNALGETARVGGWGYIFGDEGSAFDIVRQALRAVLRDHEGWGARTALTPALLEATGAADANEMLHLFYKPEWPRSRVAGLARIVNGIAEEGDPMATLVLQNSAQQLALLAATVRGRLWTDEEAVTVSWTGGVFGSSLLLDRFRNLVTLLASAGEQAITKPPVYGPARGALILAYRGPGLPVLPEPERWMRVF